MTKTKALGILAGLSTAITMYTGAAHAEGEGHASAGALLGYGFKEGVGFGLGVRGGYTLPMNVYLGGTFVYHFGKSESTAFGDASSKVLYFGVEGGYDIEAGPVLVRPFLGLGDAIVHGNTVTCIGFGGIGCASVSGSSGYFALWPGAAVFYPLDDFFVGGDARVLIVTSGDSSANAFSLFATGGLTF